MIHIPVVRRLLTMFWAEPVGEHIRTLEGCLCLNAWFDRENRYYRVIALLDVDWPYLTFHSTNAVIRYKNVCPFSRNKRRRKMLMYYLTVTNSRRRRGGGRSWKRRREDGQTCGEDFIGRRSEFFFGGRRAKQDGDWGKREELPHGHRQWLG